MVFGNKNASLYGTSSISNNIIGALNSGNYKKIIFRIIFPVFRTLVYYSLLFVLIIIAYFKINCKSIQKYFGLILLLVLFIFSSGAVEGGICYNILSGDQFYPIWILNILFVFVFIHLVRDISLASFFISRRKAFLIISVLIVLSFNVCYTFSQNGSVMERYSNQYSDKYLLNVTDYLDSANINPFGVILAGEKEIHQYPFRVGDELFGLGATGTSIKFSNKNYFATNLSIFEINETDTAEVWEKDFFKTLGFYYFVRDEKKNNQFETIKKSQLKFISENKIDFILKYKNAELPDELKSNIKMQITDSLSGESFIVLNNNK